MAVKSRLILTQNQDGDPSSTPSRNGSLFSIFSRKKGSGIIKTSVIAGIFIVAIFPPRAHAGLFENLLSFIKERVQDNDILAYINDDSLYVTAALSSVSRASGGGEFFIIDNSAVAPVSSPLVLDNDVVKKGAGEMINLYVVREGDTLSEIAAMFDVDVETILWANDIKHPSLIKPNDTLIILPVSGVQHKVRYGDTLSKIAREYSADIEEIRKYNDIDDAYTLVVGETIIIPHGKVALSSKSQRSISYVRKNAINQPSIFGYYISPVKNAVKTQGIHGWNAVDLAAPVGTPVVAAAAGTVVISRTGWNGGYGTYIVINHPNGTQTVYAHNSRNIVTVGQYVVQGQVIGYVGSTGRSTGPHVHFEVRGARNPF